MVSIIPAANELDYFLAITKVLGASQHHAFNTYLYSRLEILYFIQNVMNRPALNIPKRKKVVVGGRIRYF
jgi:hypothetical protein